MSEDRIGKLMVIDDNDVDQMLYKRVIERTGLVDEVQQFTYAEDALAVLRDGLRPDAILLDINMQRMDGFEFLEAAESEFGAAFSVVIVMLTTSLNPEDESRAAKHPMVKEYFIKPLLETQLRQVIDLIK